MFPTDQQSDTVAPMVGFTAFAVRAAAVVGALLAVFCWLIGLVLCLTIVGAIIGYPVAKGAMALGRASVRLWHSIDGGPPVGPGGSWLESQPTTCRGVRHGQRCTEPRNHSADHIVRDATGRIVSRWPRQNITSIRPTRGVL